MGNLNRRLNKRRPEAGPAAAAVGGPGRAGGRAGGAGRRHGPGRLRGHGHQERRGAGPRLAAVLRPEHLLQGHQEAGLRPSPRRGQRRPAHQPRDPGRLSHRLHLQARHRGGGARERADHTGHPAPRPGLLHRGRHGLRERRQGGPRHARAAAGAHRVERRLLLPAGRPAQQHRRRPGAAALGAPSRHRPQHRDRPARRSCPGCCPRRSGATPSSRTRRPWSRGLRATT